MDEIDLFLIRELWLDSRISFNALGQKLNISGNILKKRSDSLEESGVFVFHTNPVFSKFHFAQVAFTADIPKTHREHYIDLISTIFAEVYELVFSLEEKCAIIVLLPFNGPEGVSDETINDFRKRFHDKIPDIQLNEHYRFEYYFGAHNLKPMELNLIRLLRENSRKDLVNLSQQLGLSKKTLSRYLQKFSKNNLIMHTLGIQPSKIKNYLITMVYSIFKDNTDLRSKVEKIRDQVNWLSFFILCDPPGVVVFIYTETFAQMEEKVKQLQMVPEVSEVNVFFPSSIARFEKWKDLVIPVIKTDEELI